MNSLNVSILDRKFRFQTEEKLFSPKRLDDGSRLLLESVAGLKAKKVLDLGCGYGTIGIIYAKFHPESFVTLLDNDPIALKIAEKNCRLNETKHTKTFKADITYATLPWQFDLILSNPPWVKNRSVIPKLLEFAHAHLIPGGKLYLVINKTFQTEDILQKTFGNVITVLDQSPYKVLKSVKSHELAEE